MTVLPEDSSGDTPPVPCKRKRLTLSISRSKATSRIPQAEMDPMATFTAFGTTSKLSLNSNKAGERGGDRPVPEELPPGVSAGSASPGRKVRPTPIASLANLGNTCYLNSVLYTLRFSPNFLHSLHHVMEELGRPASSNSDDEAPSRTLRTHVACERLHALFSNLRANEDAKAGRALQPVQPSVFLSSFRDLNPTFESHQQHDAHELLVCLLDIIRDTSKQLLDRKTEPAKQVAPVASPKPPAKKSGWCKMKKSKLKLEPMKEEAPSPPVVAKPKFEPDFIKNFEGVMVSRTICMECESFTERKENFLDICVPLRRDDEKLASDEEIEKQPSQLYRQLLLSSENICGQNNKYWCEVCRHYNEVKRCTSYETLPNLLVLQLKRFSTNISSMFSMCKMHDYMPTPVRLDCFCDSCPAERPLEDHAYRLYAVIMHLGSTMASGHYVAFVRADARHSRAYFECRLHQAAAAAAAATQQPPAGSGSGILKFLKKTERPSVSSLGADACPSTDCCGVRLGASYVEEAAAAQDEPLWLECDDDHVRLLGEKEFVELLSPAKSKTLSPYILFYARQSQVQ